MMASKKVMGLGIIAILPSPSKSPPYHGILAATHVLKRGSVGCLQSSKVSLIRSNPIKSSEGLKISVRPPGSQPTAVLDSLAQLRYLASRVAERMSTTSYFIEKAYHDKSPGANHGTPPSPSTTRLTTHLIEQPTDHSMLLLIQKSEKAQQRTNSLARSFKCVALSTMGK